MTGIGDLLFVVFIVWIFLHTISYGKWTWEKKNKIGGSMLILLAFSVLLLTMYEIFIRQ